MGGRDKPFAIRLWLRRKLLLLDGLAGRVGSLVGGPDPALRA